MPVDPAIQPILDTINTTAQPVHDTLPTARLRAILQDISTRRLALSTPPPPVARVQEQVVSVEQGEIVVRIYTPFAPGPLPAHLYFHTGGFWMGTLEHCDGWCRELCSGATCVVLSVAYRLAPEYPFPTGLEDGYRALCWVFAHAAELGIDPARLSIGGASAGGNLATVIARLARERQGPPLIFQLLELPTTDLTMSQPSIQLYGEGYLLTRSALSHICSLYLSDPQQAFNPCASPLLAPDLSALPPALIMTAEFDPLRDEGEAYGQRLKEAGVPTTIKRWPGLIHTAEHMSKILPTAIQFREMAVQALLQAYACFPLSSGEQ